MVPKDKIIEGLNESQLKAVTFENGPLLILAGAGSGKTRVLTHRIAYLIAQGTSPHAFLAVTFTNKAAGEMRERIRRLTQTDVWVSTFHAACLTILKQQWQYAGLKKNFSIFDQSDQFALIKECIKELNINDRIYNPKAVLEAISRAKDQLIGVDEFQKGDWTDDVYREIYKKYEEKLREYNGVDFGDLILKCIHLLEGNSIILEWYQRRFKYILVDEYQDTNQAQYRFVNLLARAHHNLTVVGDPDQSIYGWRGADISNILSFEHDYPETTLIKLDKNYRSTQVILNASNGLIKHNAMRKHKNLWTDKAEGELLEVIESQDERHEAETVVSSILGLKQQGFDLKDIVVFYRVHAQSRILEDILRRYNMPYKIVGGVRFYDRKEVKDCLAYLRYVALPDDEVSLKRILNVPVRGIGNKAISTLLAFKQESKITLDVALSRCDSINGLQKRAKTSMKKFYSLASKWRADSALMPVSELVKEIMDDTGYIKELESENTFEARVRIENIKEFIGVIIEYEESAECDDTRELLFGFLETISLQSDIDTWDPDNDLLTLMTLHCAKGLEFRAVFIVGMEEDIFPHSNILEAGSQAIEEERRLCYVGLTRAKERVFLSYATSRRLYGYRMHNFPSRFISEIPQQFLASGQKNEQIGDCCDDHIIEYDIF